ncbi:MAG: hypothetical protein JXQ96_01740 [Cyclobacteriaceae bacterium]
MILQKTKLARLSLMGMTVLLFQFCAKKEKVKSAESSKPFDLEQIIPILEGKYTQAVESLSDSSLLPRNAMEDGTWKVRKSSDWTSGFFSGSLWQLYELTGNERWADEAIRWSTAIEKEKPVPMIMIWGFSFIVVWKSTETCR